MNVYNNLSELPSFKNAVITIGSFDGVHLGHQKIIHKVNQLAKKHGGESILITFHPHPRLFLYPDDQSLKLLTSTEEKVRLLESYGLDHTVLVPFNKEFSGQSAEEYILDFLVKKFTPACIVIGYDHRFGQNRKGDIHMLKEYAESCNFEIVEIEKEEIDDMAISSTKIRKAIEEGNIQSAQHLLNHPFTINGTVEHGQKVGNTIGFPTANLKVSIPQKIIPPYGIYAVKVDHQQQMYSGMLYIGDRPSLDDGNHRTIEVNIFDFDKDIYGDPLEIEFVSFVRKDKVLSSLEELKQQLADDKIAVQKVLKAIPQEKEETKQDWPSVAVAILNYNGRKHLEEFLPSVVEASYPNQQIHIADNGSTDDSLVFLREHYPGIQIHELEENHGFAKGYNEAMKLIDADYFVLLNSDVEVAKNWLAPIIELMEQDETIGACQPKVMAYLEKNKFEHAGAAGGWMDHWGYPFCRGRVFDHIEEDRGQYDHIEEIFWATGAAIFIRPRLFRELGGFDPDFFAHLEEIDLCWRIKRAGYKIMANPKSVVYHLGGGTLQYDNPHKTYLNFRNSLYTLVKNEPLSKLLWLIPLRLILDGVAGALFLLQKRFSHIGSILKAHFSFYRNCRKMRRKGIADQDRIRKVQISPTPNPAGTYPRSVVWQYYGRSKKRFEDL